MAGTGAADRPDFLDRLDRDPDRAGREFERYLRWFVTAHPPRVMRGMSPEDREEVTQDVAIKCLHNDFRVLRGYVSQGRPFAAWFYFVVRTTALDLLKKGRREQPLGLPSETESIARSRADLEGLSLITTGNPEATESLQYVNEAISELDQYCRLLVKMAAREFKPREMARVLRWPKETGKRISGDLSYCRVKLRRLLAARGIDPGVMG